MEASALRKLSPHTAAMEAGYLEAFDTTRDLIHESARKAYSRAHKGAYLLAVADFR